MRFIRNCTESGMGRRNILIVFGGNIGFAILRLFETHWKRNLAKGMNNFLNKEIKNSLFTKPAQLPYTSCAICYERIRCLRTGLPQERGNT